MPLTDRPGAAAPPFVVTRPLQGHGRCNHILDRVRYVRRFFPELDGKTIKIGLTRAASGMAIMGGHEIWLNPSAVSYHTISHEFVHLIQNTARGVPQGERSCDVFSMARDWTLNDVPPSYVSVPMDLLDLGGRLSQHGARMTFQAAREAVNKRGEGLRQYITYFELRVRELADNLHLFE